MVESPRAKPPETVSTGEPAQSPVERVTEKKAKDPKKVAPGVQSLPPEQLRKNDCSNGFRHPRNHYARATARLPEFLQRKRTGNAQANGQTLTVTGSHGSQGLV